MKIPRKKKGKDYSKYDIRHTEDGTPYITGLCSDGGIIMGSADKYVAWLLDNGRRVGIRGKVHFSCNGVIQSNKSLTDEHKSALNNCAKHNESIDGK